MMNPHLNQVGLLYTQHKIYSISFSLTKLMAEHGKYNGQQSLKKLVSGEFGNTIPTLKLMIDFLSCFHYKSQDKS